MWDLSSPTRTWTHTPCSGSYGPSTARVLDWVHFWLTQLLAPHAITAEGLILFIYSVFELRKSSITVSNLFVHLALNSSRVPEFQPWRNALVFVTVSAESLSPFPWALWSHLLPLACLQQYWPLSSSDKPRTCSPQVLCSCLEYSPLRFLCGCFLLSSCLFEYHPFRKTYPNTLHKRSSSSSLWLSLGPLSCFILFFSKTHIITICPFIYCLW